MTTKGLIQTIILIIVIIVVIVVVYFGRSLYERDGTKFGTWSEFSQSVCLNDNQVCTVAGTSQRSRVCTPNPTTGFGCIDTKGNQTFRPEIIEDTCTPTCYSSIWSTTQSDTCKVYETADGSTVATNQACSNPDQFRLQRVFRECVTKDTEGSSACIRQDGSIANVGDTEEFFETCDTIPECYPGEWEACPSVSLNNISQQCSLVDTDCGRLVSATTSARCFFNGDPVSTAFCFPPDNPGPCPATCFSYPCDGAYPAGFTDIAQFLGTYIEISDGTNFIEPDWVFVNVTCDPDPIDTTNASNVVVINTPAAHPFAIGQRVVISGVPGPDLNGIPVDEINGTREIVAITATSITINTLTNANATSSGGGATVELTQDPEGSANLQLEVIESYGPILTTFANTGIDQRVRFQIVPSQAEVANGAFYLIAYIPISGQLGIVHLNGGNIEIRPTPVLALGETFDDIIPQPDLFKITETSAPYTLNHYTNPGPTLTPLFCGATCITLSGCPNLVYTVGEVCIT